MHALDGGTAGAQRLARLEREFGAFDVTTGETVVPRSLYADCERAVDSGSLGGARAFVHRDGEVLLVRFDDRPDVWELPGGSASPGERLAETARLTLRAQTGLRCRPTDVVEAREQRFVLVADGDAVTGIWAFFEAGEPTGERSPGEGVAAAEWFDTDDLPDAVVPEVARRYG